MSAALGACRGAFLGTAILSGMLNLLALTGSLYMLEIYDRVLPSRSVPTLIGLGIIAAMLFAFQGVLDLIRGRILSRIGGVLDEALNGRVFGIISRLPLLAKQQGDGLQPLRDLDSVRSFLSGLGPSALFDLPWMPLYLFICFAFHPLIGITALAGAIVLIFLTILAEVYTRSPVRSASALAGARNGLAESTRRNAEVIQALGMSGRMAQRWQSANEAYLSSQLRASDSSGGFGVASKILRMALQSLVLGVGAWLVINQQATGGIIIASSILTSRALAPIELAIAHWKAFLTARQSWGRLNLLMNRIAPKAERLSLPVPCRALNVENLSVVPPGSDRASVIDASFRVEAGHAVGVIGVSASGKSSLARALVNAWPPARGRVDLDGAALENWGVDELGRHVGYVPQAVELLPGSIAENIARFDPSALPSEIISAAQAAGVHEMILRLPEAYETQVSDMGGALSAGQKQRIALARALYREPFLVVLDEPNSNLDADGENALTQAILGVRARGGIAVVIAHRPSAIAGVNLVMMMADGRIKAFGPKDAVLSQVLDGSVRAVTPLRVVGDLREASA